MRASLRSRDRVYLIDDHCARVAEHPTTLESRQHDVQRFGGRDQNVRRLAEHSRPGGRWCIAGPYRNSDFGELLPSGGEPASKFRQRTIQISLNVVIECFEGRDIEKVHRIRQRFLEPAYDQLIQLPEKRCQSLSRPRRSENQSMRSTGDRRPSHSLRITRRAESFLEPPSYQRMKPR